MKIWIILLVIIIIILILRFRKVSNFVPNVGPVYGSYWWPFNFIVGWGDRADGSVGPLPMGWNYPTGPYFW